MRAHNHTDNVSAHGRLRPEGSAFVLVPLQLINDTCHITVAAKKAWQTEKDCCSAVYGKKGCREFPSTCYSPVANPSAPANACTRVSIGLPVGHMLNNKLHMLTAVVNIGCQAEHVELIVSFIEALGADAVSINIPAWGHTLPCSKLDQPCSLYQNLR